MLFFAKGDEVVLETRPSAGVGVVTRVIPAGDEPQYEVRFGSGSKRLFSGRHLRLADTSEAEAAQPEDLLQTGELASVDDFRAFMTLAKLETPLADNLYSFAASRTERLPHQFKAVLKLLASPYGRLLIADEVGLGKTIEAGIILTELSARGSVDHVLIACPSPLKEKWRSEMRERFLLDLDVLDGPSFRDRVIRITDDPLAEPLRGIASLELLRGEENLALLGERSPRLDVVIVDEAHHMRNVGTATNELGDVLTSLSDVCVFLTATPLNLGRADFFELMRLLVPQEFPQIDTFVSVIEPNVHLNTALRHLRSGWPPAYKRALRALREVEHTGQSRRFTNSPRYTKVRATLESGASGEALDRHEVVAAQRILTELNTLSHVFTRTRKREVQELFPTRRSKTFATTFTAPERAFYDAVTNWVLTEYADRAAHLVVVTFQRLAASCLPALGRRLAEAHDGGAVRLTSDELAELEDDALIGDLTDEDPSEVEVKIDDMARSALDEMLSAWRTYAGTVDSKYDAFATALTATFEQNETDRVLVFSYFTGTIDYLAERLRLLTLGGRPLEVLKLYGPMSHEQREKAVERFRTAQGPVVLLSSEVGSEGLDFQFCSRMFNYDLPWNPMRVEQRIGRLDRYGQASELIWIMNMIVSDTVEERIFFRLYERIRIFEESIGDLEAILGDIEHDLQHLQRDALRGRLSPAEQERRSNLIADVIVRRQQEDEQFEEQSKQFLSNDEVFMDLFNDIERSRRYVTPLELQRIVERYLTGISPRLRLSEATDSEGVFELLGPVEMLRRDLLKRLPLKTRNARMTRGLLARLDEGLLLTFDPQLATANRRLEFVSLRHPIIEGVILDQALRSSLRPTGLLRLDSVEVPHAFFVFELKAHGLKDELEFAAVVLDEEGTVDEDASSTLLGRLEEASAAGASHVPAWSRPTLESLRDVALAWIVAVVERRELELTTTAEEIITAQRESLRLTAGRRQLWLNEQIQNARSERILRMRRAQLRRLGEEIALKEAELDAKVGVAVSHRLVASGYVVPAD